MRERIEVDKSAKIPVYKQIIKSVEDRIDNGFFSEGASIPSMNELSDELGISKETVKKAYSILRERGMIESVHGKGFYVTGKRYKKIKILLLFDKLSTYKQVLYSSLANEIGTTAEMTIRLHNQDVELFEHFIQENLDHFDYYIITPHFPLQSDVQRRAVKTLKKIPNRKLLVLDHNIQGLSGNYGLVYQDFEHDIMEGLDHAFPYLKKYQKLHIMSMRGSMYAPLIEKGINRFCKEHHLKFEISHSIKAKRIRSHEAYVILNSQLDQEIIKLIKIAKARGYEIGKDIGIISYNESPINEIILEGLTVFSTDFRKMGKLAAAMIKNKSFRKIKCDFQLILRHTL
jgi:DNA-binding transcriptional regulator YhcF (GntR family)